MCVLLEMPACIFAIIEIWASYADTHTEQTRKPSCRHLVNTKKCGKKQAALLQSPMDHLLAEMSICHVYIGFDDSGNSLFSSGWNWLQRRTNLFCTSLQLSTNRKNHQPHNMACVPHVVRAHYVGEGGKKKQKTNLSWGLVFKIGQQQLTLGLFSSQTWRNLVCLKASLLF